MKTLHLKPVVKCFSLLLVLWQLTVFCLPAVYSFVNGPEKSPFYNQADTKFINSLMHPSSPDLKESGEFVAKLHNRHKALMNSWHKIIAQMLHGMPMPEVFGQLTSQANGWEPYIRIIDSIKYK